MISVVVPVYKAEKYIRQCVDSILAQTFRDFELILVDDGSPDNCGKICDGYAAQDSRIKVVHRENGGPSAARNAGLDLAQGEYVAFVDSDDYIREEMFETLLRALVRNNVGIAICDYERVADDGTVKNEVVFPPDLREGIVSNRTAFDGFSGEYCFFWGVLWNKLYRRELFKDVRFPVGKTYEELHVVPTLFYRSGDVAVVSKKLYSYRDAPQSITSNEESPENKLSFLEAVIARMRFFEKLNMTDIVYKDAKGILRGYVIRFLNGPKVDRPELKKRLRLLKKDVRYFLYKYDSDAKFLEKFYFEFPRLFKFLQRSRNAVRNLLKIPVEK